MTPEQRQALVEAAVAYGDAAFDEGSGVDGTGINVVIAWGAFLSALNAVARWTPESAEVQS